MNKEFIPYEQALELKELGFDEECFRLFNKDGNMEPVLSIDTNKNSDRIVLFSERTTAPLYQQAFRWFREKYGFTYSIGNTNIAVVHYLGTTQLLQNNESYEAAELATLKKFIEVAKQEKL
jgi:hypothetical protein